MILPRTGCSVILYHADKVLLVKRAKAPFEGCWSLPGGSQIGGETLEACARRELVEETGLTAGPLKQIATLDHISGPEDDLDYHFVLTTFLGNEYEGILQSGDDAADCRWFGIDEITAIATTPGLSEFVAVHVGAASQ